MIQSYFFFLQLTFLGEQDLRKEIQKLLYLKNKVPIYSSTRFSKLEHNPLQQIPKKSQLVQN